MTKSLIQKADQVLFNAFFYNQRANFIERRLLQRVRKANDHHIVISYAKNYKNELSQLCDKYGSDKGEISKGEHPYVWPSHSYADFYELMFQQKRFSIQMVLECGLGTSNPNLPSSMGEEGKPGASLRVWRDYFPKATIIGVDIDSDILFKEERIETYRVDQTSDSSINDFLNLMSDRKSFDIIIDDGLHEFTAGKCLFEGAIQQLAPDGVYIIEDVVPDDFEQYVEYFDRLKDHFYVRFINLFRPNSRLRDNSLVMITKKNVAT